MLAASVAALALGPFVSSSFAAPPGAGALTFEEHVACRTAIERVNYSHRTGATRPFEEAVSRRAIERQVQRYFHQADRLDRDRPGDVTADTLQREWDRIARRTRMPDRLREMYAALNDDPILIQECLIRPTLVARLAMVQGDEQQSTGPDGKSGPSTIRRVAKSTTIPFIASGRPEQSRAASPACSGDDQWVNGILDDSPDPRTNASAVWTGSEVIVWGGVVGGLPNPAVVNTGGRYDPATETWTAMSTIGAPSPRRAHTAVWTGTEMIVWGGDAIGPIQFGSGGRYNPVTDTWAPLSMTNAPTPRSNHKAVWTGSLMIILDGGSNSGGRYDPTLDSWSSTTSAGAPDPLSSSTAVWTGSRVIFWGAHPSNGQMQGGRYDPVLDHWDPMSGINQPIWRTSYTAVWTGQEMIAWGGAGGPAPPCRLNNGGRYNPVTDTWVSIPSGPTGRMDHTAVWTGDRMVVWGGMGTCPGSSMLTTGAAYDPITGLWTDMTVAGAPTGRVFHSATWTGSRLFIWGGQPDGGSGDGALFNPAANAWTPVAQALAPAGDGRTAVWTGTEMITWGLMNRGARYDPMLDAWSPISNVDAPTGADGHSAVWTGERMIIWGGRQNGERNGAIDTGALYDPVTDTWQSITTVGAPAPRLDHIAVWTGQQMIVWGGVNSYWSDFVSFNSGGRYDPVLDTWSPTSTAGVTAFSRPTGVWTGSLMIVWQGFVGHRYDPALDTWTSFFPSNFNLGGGPAVWTGSRMIMWGGGGGGRYDPVSNTWFPITTVSAPAARSGHSAVWTGSHMIVWGGQASTDLYLGDGGRYDPVLDKWTPLSLVNAPKARIKHQAIWDGEGMIVFGGYEGWNTGGWNKGGRYILSQDADHDGFTACGGDCNDANPAIRPGATEICDGFDQNCNQIVDDAPDTDGDGVGACVDCAEGNAQVWALPAEVANFSATAGVPATFAWDSLASQAGSQISYDVITGSFSAAGGFDAASAACLGSTTVASFQDARPNPAVNAGYWYLVGGRNTCGHGTLGTPQRDAVGLGLCP